jgi:hypothetical protein
LDQLSAIVAFTEESMTYCKGINDKIAQEYAVGYAEMIGQRVRGEESRPPKVRHDLFAPSRRLISSTLEEIHDKYFPAKTP